MLIRKSTFGGKSLNFSFYEVKTFGSVNIPETNGSPVFLDLTAFLSSLKCSSVLNACGQLYKCVQNPSHGELEFSLSFFSEKKWMCSDYSLSVLYILFEAVQEPILSKKFCLKKTKLDVNVELVRYFNYTIIDYTIS